MTADAAPVPGWDLGAGERIGPERTVLAGLGGGSDFDVYLVWDERRFCIAVAKLLRPHLVKDATALRHLRREAEALGRLAHPVLVRGFDAVFDPPHPHLLIEHLEGPTLRSTIRRGGALALQQLLPLALHVAAALHYLAAEGWVHLDVKPANIVMGVPPRLLDLSVARPLEDAARLRSPLGTDAYMAPEQCHPAVFPGGVGSAADVWGLGATLHHAIGGEVPFPRAPEDHDSDDLHVRFPQLVSAPRRLPSATPTALADLVETALGREPGRRPTAEAFAMALEPLVDALPRRMTLSRRGLG